MTWIRSCSALPPGVLQLGWHGQKRPWENVWRGWRQGDAEVPPALSLSALQYDQKSISKACGKDAQTRLAHCRCTMEVSKVAEGLPLTKPAAEPWEAERVSTPASLPARGPAAPCAPCPPRPRWRGRSCASTSSTA